MNNKSLDNILEKGILLLILIALIFSALATGAVRTLEFAIVQVLVALTGVLWIVRLWLAPKNKRLLFPPIVWVMCIFIGYALYHYLNADVEYTARREVLRLFVYTMMFIVILNNLYKSDYTQIIIYALVLTGALIAMYGIIQVIISSDYVWHFIRPAQYLGRGSGTFINPNHFAGWLGMLLPACIAYVLIGRLNLTIRILLGYAAIMILCGIAISMSRGGWISTSLMLLVFISIIGWQKKFRLKIFIAVCVFLSAIFLFFIKSDFAQSRISKANTPGSLEHVQSRSELWIAASNVWKEEKLLGVGPGHFDHRFSKHRPPSLQSQPVRVHNDYLNILVDWGIIGLFISIGWMIALAYLIKKIWKYSQRTASDFSPKTSNRAAFVLGSTIGLGSLTLHSFVDFNLHIPSNAMLASTFAALLTSFIRFATERYWIPIKITLRLSLSIVVCGIAGIMIQQSIIQLLELQALNASQRTKTFPEQIAKLELAMKSEPNNYETAASIGEIYRIKASSLELTTNNPELDKARKWLLRAIELNPYDAYSHARLGMVLNRLDQKNEAERMFKISEELDPNGYMTISYIAWHKMNIGGLTNLTTAKRYFERVSPPDKPENGLIAWRSETSATNLVNQIRAVYLPYINEQLQYLD